MGITTHVLDTARGLPAAGVPVRLEIEDAGGWSLVGQGATDGDGRLRTLLDGFIFKAGTYRITFDTGAYFSGLNVETFFPEASIVFVVREAAQHYHVPLLVSPFGYSTYRGS